MVLDIRKLNHAYAERFDRMAKAFGSYADSFESADKREFISEKEGFYCNVSSYFRSLGDSPHNNNVIQETILDLDNMSDYLSSSLSKGSRADFYIMIDMFSEIMGIVLEGSERILDILSPIDD